MPALNLIDVYSREAEAIAVLYHLLAEREPFESISHKTMPHHDQHCAFVRSRPYLAWYLIELDSQHVGAVYLSKQREIGISVFKRFRGNGIGERAIRLLMAQHPGQFLANINPTNAKSITLFAKLGFTHLQNTYTL